MADEQKTNPETTNVESEKDQNALHMESVERISKLPVVESTINAATNMYEKVKVSHYPFTLYGQVKQGSILHPLLQSCITFPVFVK